MPIIYISYNGKPCIKNVVPTSHQSLYKSVTLGFHGDELFSIRKLGQKSLSELWYSQMQCTTNTEI